MDELRNYDAKQTDRIIKVALALLIVTCFFAGCESKSINPFTTAPDKGVTVENILSNPKDYTGKEVTVVAAVSKTVGDRAFLLHGENLMGELLVVGGDPYPSQPNERVEHGFMLAQSVRVTGTVEAFDPVAVERATGVRRDDERLQNYRGVAMIIATSVETLNP